MTHTCHAINPPHPYPCLACEYETPWTVEKVLYPAGQDVSFEVKAGRRFICQTIMREVIRENDDIARDEANARLIAAAPEMLEVVKGVAALSKLLLDPNQVSFELIDRARAAIAKAEGRQAPNERTRVGK